MICLEKLVTRELSNMSIEAYHGDKAASVPFEWESQPGTPKFKSRDASLPPLTPPPSYYNNKTSMSKKGKPKKNINLKPRNFLQTLLFTKRDTKNQPPLPSQSSSSSPYSSFTSLAFFSAPSSPVIHSHKIQEEEDLYDVELHNTARWGNGCSYMIKKVLPRDFM